ncbi:hypothetical protein, partial [Selenomonas felix]|uniref:hypothetical protein n=1 Tax=Selenomonas felix TaxID=1944634 RepID=UPI00110F1FE8
CSTMILFHFAVSLSVSFCVVTKSLTEPFAKWNFLRQFILQLTTRGEDRHYVRCRAILNVLPPPIPAPKGGVPMELFTSFLLSVMAGIVTHYVCKWLDGE